MLPFLKKSQESAIGSESSPVKRTPDNEDQEYDVLESAVSDLFDAYKSGDVKAGAAALRAAFELCDAEPHHEGSHE